MITRINGKTNASWMKSLGLVRSHTRYHFVYGTPEETVAEPAEPAALNGDGDDSGTPEKSAKPVAHMSVSQWVVMPSKN